MPRVFDIMLLLYFCGVITQSEKMELAESYEAIAGHCLKAVITMEIGQQKLEQRAQAPSVKARLKI